MEDWALIRSLAAEGVPKKQIAERLRIGDDGGQGGGVVGATEIRADTGGDVVRAVRGAGAGVAGGASGDAGDGARRAGGLVGVDHVVP